MPSSSGFTTPPTPPVRQPSTSSTNSMPPPPTAGASPPNLAATSSASTSPRPFAYGDQDEFDAGTRLLTSLEDEIALWCRTLQMQMIPALPVDASVPDNERGHNLELRAMLEGLPESIAVHLRQAEQGSAGPRL